MFLLSFCRASKDVVNQYGMYLFKVSSGNTRTIYEIGSNLTKKDTRATSLGLFLLYFHCRLWKNSCWVGSYLTCLHHILLKHWLRKFLSKHFTLKSISRNNYFVERLPKYRYSSVLNCTGSRSNKQGRWVFRKIS